MQKIEQTPKQHKKELTTIWQNKWQQQQRREERNKQKSV